MSVARPLHRRRARRERGALRRRLADRRAAVSPRSRAAARGRPISALDGRASARVPGLGGARARRAAREHLHRLADLIDANVERLAEVECLDMAMLLRSLRARVIARGARNFRAYADLAVGARGARLVVERHREPRASAARPGPRS